jgi:ABC-type transport system substrate-binding protein
MLVRQLQDDLSEAGVDLIGRPLPFLELLDALADGEAGLYRFAWLTETPSAYAAIAPLIAAGEPRAGVNVNYGRYEDPGVQQLLAAARTARDENRRQRLLAEAEDIALGRDQAVIPLYTTRSRLLVADRVSGFRLDPFAGVDLEDVTVR